MLPVCVIVVVLYPFFQFDPFIATDVQSCLQSSAFILWKPNLQKSMDPDQTAPNLGPNFLPAT